MLDKMVLRMVQYLVANHMVSQEEAEVYAYGLGQLILTLVNIATIIFLGLIFRMVGESILFMIAYMPLRTYSGGYYGKTRKESFIYGILILLTAFIIIRYLSYSELLVISLLSFSGILIFSLAPVGVIYQKLGQDEIEKYKVKSRLLFIGECSITILFALLGLYHLAVTVTIATVTLGLMLALGNNINH